MIGNRKRAAHILFLAAMSWAAGSRAASIPWTNAAGGNFNTSGNWNSGAGPVPGALDTVQFNIANTYSVTLDISPTVTSMSVAGSNLSITNSIVGRTMKVNGTMFVNSGSFTLSPATPVVWTVNNNSGFNTAVGVGGGSTLSLQGLGVGGAGSSNTIVNGTGSNLSAIGFITIANGAGLTGTLTYSNNAAGTLSTVEIATAGSSTGNLNVQSGADVTNGGLSIASAGGSASQIGNATVTGAGSTLTQFGGGTTIGAASASLGTMTVSSQGSVSAASITINPTGELDILSGGTVSSGGSVIISNGTPAHGRIIVSGASSALTMISVGAMFIGSGSGNPALLQVISGGTCTLSPGGMSVNATGVVDIDNGTFNANGDTTVTGTIGIHNGSTFTLASFKKLTVNAGGLIQIDTGGKLDMKDDKLLFKNGTIGSVTGSTYSGITGMVQSGRNGNTTPLWDGSGIVTSQTTASGGNLHSIGVALGSEVKSQTTSTTAVWAGYTITSTDVLVMYTYGGDANLDGKINIDDYVRIDQGIAGNLKGWSNGDFNYDSKVNIDDYTAVIDSNIGSQGAPFATADDVSNSSVTAVPEPAVSMAFLLCAGLLKRNRRLV